MKKVDRWAALTAALLLTVSLAPASQAAEAGEKIVILHTNDVHCALDDAIGYAGLAGHIFSDVSRPEYQCPDRRCPG